MPAVVPGTYRIINVGSGTCITARTYKDVVCWRRHDGRNQQWFVQRSGQGYRIKNCEQGFHLAVSSTNTGSKVYCGRYPTTWELSQGHEDHNMYMIKYGDNNQILDLDGWGGGHDGNEIHTFPQDWWVAHKRWRFERLSDDTGEEDYRLNKEIVSKNKEIGERDRALSTKDQELKEKDRQNAEQATQIADKDRQLAQTTERMVGQDQELARLRSDLTEQTSRLAQAQGALRQANDSLASRDAELFRIQAQIKNDHLERDLTRQREETAHLRAQMEEFQRLFSRAQTPNPNAKKVNNMA